MAWALSGLLGLAGSASAVDGVVEINQVCAVHTGCVAGDTPGFPVTVAAGSYVLTGPLSVTDPNLDGIEVLSDDFHLDMNGFEIAGPGACTGAGSTIACAPTGTGVGIDAGTRDRITVRDGRVLGFAGRGVNIDAQSRVENLVAQDNGGHGIRVGSRSMVIHSIANRNGGSGISGTEGSVVDGCITSSNRFDGIQATGGASVRRSIAWLNGDDGINTLASSVVRDSMALANEGDGVDAGTGNLVSDSAVRRSGDSGIRAGPGSSVQRNMVSRSTNYGLQLAADVAYRENTLDEDHEVVPKTIDGGVNLGANSCNGRTTCP